MTDNIKAKTLNVMAAVPLIHTVSFIRYNGMRDR